MLPCWPVHNTEGISLSEDDSARSENHDVRRYYAAVLRFYLTLSFAKVLSVLKNVEGTMNMCIIIVIFERHRFQTRH